MVLERLGYVYSKKESIFELNWNDAGVTYKDVCLKNEIEQSYYNFILANVDFKKTIFFCRR